ncbi:hypothetical protein NQK81_30825 [Amycolatopsis roodepoortensis]|uniref:hypothetical protein n=1 Tax=Amycolatopsis roodepoortensis TaxID=700274 RepID=UPI00214CE30F|nr:hypothetical protein [Amycolatopsis roodepoortensis]UUV29153.1 hypothetical protein NQK81_30825 [Amycolatopsis roodepoortensis]
MHEHDRKLFAGIARVNADIGRVTLELFTLQPDDAAYAEALRKVGTDLVRIGVALTYRAAELDGKLIDPGDNLTDPAAQEGDPP